MKRNELLRSPDYWFEAAQNELYRQLVEYQEAHRMTQTQLAEHLGVTKGYVSQVLKGEFNYTLRKLIELSLAVGKVPTLSFTSMDVVLAGDEQQRPIAKPRRKVRRGVSRVL